MNIHFDKMFGDPSTSADHSFNLLLLFYLFFIFYNFYFSDGEDTRLQIASRVCPVCIFFQVHM